MSILIQSYDDINRSVWSALIDSSKTATWFQTPEAYDFFLDQPELFLPFVVAISVEKELRAVCVGYITQDKNALKQFVTRRAIIIGGPVLANDCTDDEVYALMNGVRDVVGRKAIYIETRNFNDYSRWREGFARAGFKYEKHLNFHVHTNQPWETIESAIGKHRKKYIRLSFRDGAIVVENPTIEQVKEYYLLLSELYDHKVKTPLQPWSFFEQLYNLKSCRYLLVEYQGKIIGGSVCMALDGHGVYEWFACGKDGEYKNIYPSSVTKYAGMKYAHDNGYPIFDMMGAGKPGVGYGVREFKAEFGGELVEHGRYRYVCSKFLFLCGIMGIKVIRIIK